MVKLSPSMKWGPGQGSRGIAPLILNLRARHSEWSNSCCRNSPSLALGKLPLNTHWIGCWVGSRADVMFWKEKNLLPMLEFEPWAVQPIAWSLYWLQYSRPSRKQRCRNLWVVGSCKFHYYWSLTVIHLRFMKVKLSVCMPWRHIWRTGGTASLIPDLSTRWEWVEWSLSHCQI